jgi:DNA repair protein RadC
MIVSYKTKIDSCFSFVEAVWPIFDGKTQESFWVFALNTKHRVIGAYEASVGTLSTTIVHPREIFRTSIMLGAAAIIVCHNHPSGEPQPSSDDDAVTNRLVESGKLLGVPVLDHVVIGTRTDFYSYAQNGKI